MDWVCRTRSTQYNKNRTTPHATHTPHAITTASCSFVGFSFKHKIRYATRERTRKKGSIIQRIYQQFTTPGCFLESSSSSKRCSVRRIIGGHRIGRILDSSIRIQQDVWKSFSHTQVARNIPIYTGDGWNSIRAYTINVSKDSVVHRLLQHSHTHNTLISLMGAWMDDFNRQRLVRANRHVTSQDIFLSCFGLVPKLQERERTRISWNYQPFTSCNTWMVFWNHPYIQVFYSVPSIGGNGREKG